MGKWIFILLGALPAFILGCSKQDQGDDRLQEKAKIEGRQAAEEEIKAQNEAWISKATDLEKDLAIRHRFYQAIKGTYEGEMKSSTSKYKIKMTFVPSLPPYIQSGRIRQVEEIVADINSLYLNVQVVQWDPEHPTMGAVGCRIEAVKPDITTGVVEIASENCTNFYGLWVAQATPSGDTQGIKSTPLDPKLGPSVAAAIREGQVDTVTEIQGEVQPTNNALVFTFSATRKVQ